MGFKFEMNEYRNPTNVHKHMTDFFCRRDYFPPSKITVEQWKFKDFYDNYLKEMKSNRFRNLCVSLIRISLEKSPKGSRFCQRERNNEI